MEVWTRTLDSLKSSAYLYRNALPFLTMRSYKQLAGFSRRELTAIRHGWLHSINVVFLRLIKGRLLTIHTEHPPDRQMYSGDNKASIIMQEDRFQRVTLLTSPGERLAKKLHNVSQQLE